MDSLEELMQYFQKTCRICLCTGELKKISQEIVDFFQIINVDIDDGDKLPKTVCEICCKKVKESLNLIKIVKDSNDYLNQLVNETPDELIIDSEVIVTTEVGDNILLKYDININGLNGVEEVMDPNKSIIIEDYTKTDQPLKECHKCGKQTKSLSVHYKQNKSCRPLQCELCGKPFTKLKLYNYHLQKHEKLQDAKFYCFYCGTTLRDEPSYKSHLFIHKYVNADNPKKCGVCNKEFSSKGNLVRHIRIHNPIKRFSCNICKKKFSDNFSLKKHSEVHSFIRYECDYCGKLFKNQLNYQIHEATHQNLSPFKCELCDRQYSKKNLLDKHIFENHTNNVYQCKYCHEQFKKKTLLITHEDAHKGKIPQCQVCGNIFKNKYSLHTHSRSHELEQCPYCNKPFSKTYIKSHIMIHTGERPYKCQVCLKEFRQHVHWRTHMMQHTGDYRHKCEICDKTFICRESYLSHMRKHTGERFKCIFCDKLYMDQSTMKKHVRRDHY